MLTDKAANNCQSFMLPATRMLRIVRHKESKYVRNLYVCPNYVCIMGLCVLSVFFSKIFFCVNMCLVVLRIVLLLFLLLLFFCFQNDLFASCFLFDAFRCTCCSIVNVRWSTLQYMIDQQCNYLFHVAHKNIDHTSYIVLSPLEVSNNCFWFMSRRDK